MKLARRLKQIPPSPVRMLVPLANEAKKAGVKVYHLNIGDPDIETPAEMLRVLKDWETNPIGYAQPQGDLELLELPFVCGSCRGKTSVGGDGD